jgi:hypothetical protein
MQPGHAAANARVAGNVSAPERAGTENTIILAGRRQETGSLRYLAENVPEIIWRQLSLEQVPMNGPKK